MSTWELIARIVGMVFALALVLLSAWLVLRWVGGKMPGVSGGSGRLIQVLDRFTVGKGSSILLVRVQDKVLLVAISEHAVEKLCEFDDPDGELALPQKAGENVKFSDALKDAVNQFKNRGGKGDAP